jgi:elongation factor Tu
METYQRTLPHLNVGTIGHLGHGKTTLTAALGTVMAKRFGGQPITVAQLDDSNDERAAGSTIDTSRVEYRSAARHYAHVDCPGNLDYIANMIAGASQVDVAILVVSAAEGVMPQTREHIHLARQAGAVSILPFLNKCDLVTDEHALVQLEADLRALLRAYGYPGDTVPVGRGSALRALGGDARSEEQIAALVTALESAVAVPDRRSSASFLMAIDKALVIDGSTAVTGRIERGTVKEGDVIEVLGPTGSPSQITCKGVRMFDKLLTEGRAGDSVSILLRGVRCDDTLHGQTLQAVNGGLRFVSLPATIYFLSRDAGGRSEPIEAGFTGQFYFRTAEVTGTIQSMLNADLALPGDSVEVSINLDTAVPLEQGMHFSLREGGITVGLGVVGTLR